MADSSFLGARRRIVFHLRSLTEMWTVPLCLNSLGYSDYFPQQSWVYAFFDVWNTIFSVSCIDSKSSKRDANLTFRNFRYRFRFCIKERERCFRVACWILSCVSLHLSISEMSWNRRSRVYLATPPGIFSIFLDISSR